MNRIIAISIGDIQGIGIRILINCYKSRNIKNFILVTNKKIFQEFLNKNRKHKLGASGPHRSAMMGNLSVALITHSRIETTLSKARALRPFVEKIITLAKKAEKSKDPASKLHFRRLAIARVRDKAAVSKLFDVLVGEFTERNGGYTRIYKLGQRVGDAAEMALIELIDAELMVELKFGAFAVSQGLHVK